MRIGRMLLALSGGVAFALPAAAQTSVDWVVQPTDAPYVNVSLLGTDVLVRPQRMRYRVTADPGAYVSVILISPQGQRTVLNPYEKAIAGTGRHEIVRDAATGYQSGESYLVAVATRNKFHSANLLRQSEAAARLASAHFSAEGSLDELLTSILPAAGNDFSVAYVAFRVLSRGFPLYQFAQRCPISSQYAFNGSINDGFYRNRVMSLSLYDSYQDDQQYASFLGPSYFASACQDRLIAPPMLIATLPVPVLPPPPRRDSSATPVDSVPHAGAPTGPIVHNPVAPHPLNVEPPGGTVGRAMMPLSELRRTDPLVAPQQPVATERREPLMQVPFAPRIDPVVPIQREPVSQPPVPMEPRAMPVQPMTPSPSPPPPPPPVSSPTPLPPATGTTPTIPPR